MNLTAIWIKAISLIVLAFLGPICGIYAKKKFDWKEYEVAFVFLISIVVFAFGVENVVYIADPKIETVSVKYICQTSGFVIFGKEYNFEDDYGNDYCLTMDFITHRNTLKGKELDKNTEYIITFEEKSETILSIEEKSN